MTVKIQKASTDVPYVNMLIHADSGAGKTVVASSGRPGKILFLAPEDDGIMSGIRLGYEFDKIKVRSWPDLLAGYSYLYDNPDVLSQYDWLVIDSLTEMQSMCMRYIVGSQEADRKARDQDPDQPQIQDYGKLYILLEKMVLAFNDLPCNVLYTSLSRMAEDSDGNEFLIPMLGSNDTKKYNFSMKIVSHMTSYGYLKVEIVDKPVANPVEGEKNTRKVKQRTIYWEDTGTIRAKDRTTRLAPKTVLPSRNALIHLTDIINGAGTKDAGATKRSPAKKASPKVEKSDNNEPKEDAKETDLVSASVEA